MPDNQNSQSNKSDADSAAKQAAEDAAKKEAEKKAAEEEAKKKSEDEKKQSNSSSSRRKKQVDDDYDPYQDGDVKSSYLAEVIAKELSTGHSPTLQAIRDSK